MDDVVRYWKFKEKYGMKFLLIVDIEWKMIDFFGVWGFKKFMGWEFDGILCMIFIIDEDGRIE